MCIDVIFIDIDGTLADNFFIHTKGWDAIVSVINKTISPDFYETLHGESTECAIIKILNFLGYSYSKPDLQRFINLKNSIRDQEISKLTRANLFPEALSFLEFLKEKSIKIVCCAITNRCREILSQVGIIDYFSGFICGKNMGTLKSIGPNCYLDFIRKNLLEEEKCIVIDDDIKVIKGLGKTKIYRIHFDSSDITDGTYFVSKNYIAVKEKISQLIDKGQP